MTATIHKVTTAVVKVSIGDVTGNRVARFVYRDGIVPEGVSKDQLDRLAARGLIEPVKVPTTEELEAQAAADATASQAELEARIEEQVTARVEQLEQQRAADAAASERAAKAADTKKAGTTPAK